MSWVPLGPGAQAGELADLRRQAGQLVAAQVQRLQAGELADLRRQAGELIASKLQFLEAGELGAAQVQRCAGW